MQTRSVARKGKKLKGLTEAEATQRSKKAWITKHRKYQYASEVTKRSRPKRADFSDEEFDKMSFDEMDARIRAARESPSETDMESEWRARREAEDRRIREEADFADREFRNEVTRRRARGTSAPMNDRERAAFRANLIRERRLRERYRKLDVGMTSTDIGYLDPEEGGTQREVLRRLHSQVNKDPKIKGLRLTGGRLEEGTPDVNRARIEVPGETRRRARTEIANTLIVPDPASGEGYIDLSSGLPVSPSRRSGRRALDTSSDEVRELVDNIVKSHHAPTPEERFTAQKDAEQAIGRLAIKADEIYDTKRQQARIMALPEAAPPSATLPYQRTTKQERKEKLSDEAMKAAESRARQRATDRFKEHYGKDPTEEDIQRVMLRQALRDPVPHDPRIAPTMLEEWRNRQPGYEGWKRFHKDQQERRKNAWVTGHASIGLTEDRGLSPITSRNDRRLAAAIVPNKEWEYTLHNYEIDPNTQQNLPPYKRTLEYYDREHSHTIQRRRIPGFRVGRRNRDTGRLLPGEADEIIDVKLRRKFDTAVHFEPGDYRLKTGREPKLPTGVAERLYVPMSGAKGQKRTMNHPTDTTRQYQVMDTQGRWHPASFPEWNNAQENRRTQTQIPKKIEYVYMDPTELAAPANKPSQTSFQIPAKTIRGRTFGERRLLVNLPEGSRRHQIIGAPMEARTERRRRLASQEAQAALEMHNNQVDPLKIMDAFPHMQAYDWNSLDENKAAGELGVLLGAGAAAAAYRSRSALEQKMRHSVNVVGGKIIRKTPLKNYNPDEIILDVNEAYTRPLAESMLRKKEQIRHPLSSPEGTTMGIDWGRWRYREHGIKPDKREMRAFEKSAKEIERVVSTKEKLAKRAGKKGLRGRIARWQLEPIMQHKDYSEFDKFLDSRLERAHELDSAMNAPNPNKPTFTWKDTRTGEIKTGPLTTRLTHSAKEFQKKIDPWMERNQNVEQSLGKELFDLPYGGRSRIGRIAHGAPTPNEKALLYTGAAIGAAVGSHYLYHKYQQRKLDEADRVAYYNKIIPGPVKTKVPYARVKARYQIPRTPTTHVLGWENKRLPVELGFGIKEKTIWKGAPMDRKDPFSGQTYGKNTRLVGGVRPVAQSRAGIGSRLRGTVFNQDDPHGRRAQVRGTHKLFVKGHRAPLDIRIDPEQNIALRPQNPRQISPQDRKNIVWAHMGESDDVRNQVKNFYSFGKVDRIVDIMEDPEALDVIRRQKGGDVAEARYYREFYRGARPYRELLTGS